MSCPVVAGGAEYMDMYIGRLPSGVCLADNILAIRGISSGNVSEQKYPGNYCADASCDDIGRFPDRGFVSI